MINKNTIFSHLRKAIRVGDVVHVSELELPELWFSDSDRIQKIDKIPQACLKSLYDLIVAWVCDFE